MEEYSRRLLGSGKGIIAWSRFARFRQASKQIVRTFGDQKPDVILDIGAADGIGMPFWKKLANKVISVNYYEIHSDQFKSAWPNETIITADARNMPLEDDSVDVVISLETLHFCPNQQARNECLDEIKRVLKSRGLFICSVAIEVGLPAFIKYCARRLSGFDVAGMTFKMMFKHCFHKIFDVTKYDCGEQVGFDAYQFSDEIASRFNIIRRIRIPFPYPCCFNLMIVAKHF